MYKRVHIHPVVVKEFVREIAKEQTGPKVFVIISFFIKSVHPHFLFFKKIELFLSKTEGQDRLRSHSFLVNTSVKYSLMTTISV